MWGMRSHLWKFELSGGRGVRWLCLWRNYQQWVKCLHPGSHTREQQKEHVYERPTESSLQSFETVQPFSQVFSFLSSAFPLKWICIYSPVIFCSIKEAFSLFYFKLNPFISGVLVFLSTCHFFNSFGGYLFIPFTPTKLHISTFWPLGFVAQQGSEGEFLLLDRPNLLPSLSCCVSKERSYLLTVFYGEGCFLFHTVRSRCQPSLPALVEASWLLPWEYAFLPPQYCLPFSEFCSCTYPAFQPQQVFLFPSVGNVLWSIFCWGKGHW